MKDLHCSNCDSLVFFDNVECLSCGYKLVFDPATLEMVSFPEPLSKGLVIRSQDRELQLCKNHLDHGICNWAVDVEDGEEYCVSCRLTRTVPDLSVPENVTALAKVEKAKRVLLYDLAVLGLRPVSKETDPDKGLVFDLKVDTDKETVLTGHASGVVTLNLAEADDVERERRRTQMGEPYRTLLGHFRHEVGHYYWERLVKDSTPETLEAYRRLFGDETFDYGEALKSYYAGNRNANWSQSFISEYASAHSWEDWAETWAHYIHIRALAETAAACGVRIEPESDALPVFDCNKSGWEDWPSVTYLVNQLNRSMGLRDAYPFVVSEAVTEKLGFIDSVVRAAAGK